MQESNDLPEDHIVTVIIPTYNRSAYLRRSIGSVLSQTYPHVLVYVYDNGSTDDTELVVKNIISEDSRVYYHKHEKNIGMIDNFNFGMSRVDTEYFTFLCDDDVFLPKFLEAAITGFNEHPDAKIYACTTICATNTEIVNVPLDGIRDGYYAPPEAAFMIARGLSFSWPGTIFQRDVLRLGALDRKTEQAFDQDFNLRVSLRYPVVISTTPGAIFYIHKGSSTSNAYLDDIWPSRMNLIKNITNDADIPADQRSYCEQHLHEWLANEVYFRGAYAARDKDFKSAYRASRILHEDLHDRVRSMKVILVINMFKYFSPAYRLIKSTGALRKHANNDFNVRYGEYLAYVKTGGQ